MNISPDELDTISQKVRAAFLEEDAPGYIEALRAGLQHSYRDADYFSLLSALHSLKGGAGIAQFHSLQRLAHSLEDLIQSLQDKSCTDQELAWSLFIRATEEIDNAFKLGQGLTISLELLQDLEEFNQSFSKPGEESFKSRFTLSNTITTASQVGKRVWETAQRAVAKFKRAVDSNNSEAHSPPGDTAIDALNENLIQIQEESCVQFINQSSTIENPERPIPPAPSPARAAPNLGKILRLPLEQLDQMTETAEELIAYNQKLCLQHQQLEQANLRLQTLAPQFQQVRSSLQTVVDGLNFSSSPTLPADLDTITTLHGNIQVLQELISLFQEAKSDIKLVASNLTENQKETRRDLEKLYTTLTRSRLVPFKKLAQLFLPYVGRLNQRYGKEVKLAIRGGEVLVDQSILEELRPPLNHLINNAFDHGIEPTEERIALKKPQRAEIILQVTAQENELIFSVSDDGRGIEPQKIYRRALQRGLTSQSPMSELSQEEILSFLFQPGFSTASNPNDLSGRGMGLDIVRDQVSSLRGTLQIKTIVGQGTTFIIKLPPSLSFLPLLLCQLQKRTVAIPSTSILEILSYAELKWSSINPPLAHWKQSDIPVVHLSSLLQYSNTITNISQLPDVTGAVVLNGPNAPLIAIVDTLIRQQKLIVKPLAQIVKSPPYLAGCTILPTGEIVPVLLPQKFGSLLQKLDSLSTQKSTSPPIQQTKNKIILVAEDSQATRILIEGLLKEEGFDVICCHDGQEALEEFLRHSEEIDLVISDVEMPRVDGFAFLQQIRQVRPQSTLPVIILSSRSTDNYTHQAMDLGANAFVNKQFLSENLLLRVNEFIKSA